MPGSLGGFAGGLLELCTAAEQQALSILDAHAGAAVLGRVLDSLKTE